ncbi:TonB-dependent receptor domain-containing protein [Novosphingobium lindaniclasticum]
MGRRAKINFLGATALASMFLCSPAAAQAAEKQHYNLEAGALGDALQAVSRLSGREIIFSSESVIGRNAPRLEGTYSADEAVRRLLSGSGLKVQFRPNVILIGGRQEGTAGEPQSPALNTDILVTASRIKGAPSPSPMIVTSREQIQEAGVTDLGSFARTLPQNFGGGQNPGVVGNPGQSENTNGSSTMNLRGLGPDATLTLINGHRIAYDAVSQGVDIAAIPLIAVDRIDVVTDGASALYGSDAVGGVANVILRRDYEGLLTSARFGAATDGGDVEEQLSAVTGKRWGSGGVMIAADFLHSSEIRASQRSYTQKMDGTATLLPAQRQFSAVLSGHQQIASALELEIDAQFNARKSQACNPFLATAGCLTSGNAIDRRVRSFSISPSLRLKLSDAWEARLTATHGESRTKVYTRAFSAGNLSAQYYPDYANDLDAVDLGFEGPVFKAPGGEARVAIGGGFRKVTLTVDSRQVSGGVTSQTYLFEQKRDTFFGYGEFLLPLVGPSNAFAGMQRLSITGAARYEHNQGFGDLATPKVGVTYSPIEDVTLSATWGRSFKAPTLYQVGQPLQGYLVPGSLFTPSGPGGAPAIILNGGRPDLKPEKARTWTATLAVSPRTVPGLKAQVSAFDILYRNRVVTPIANLLSAFSAQYANLTELYPSQATIADLVASLPGGLINQTGAPYDPTSVTAIVDDSLRNAARQRVRGFDLSLAYSVDLDSRDKLEFEGSGSYLESRQALGPGEPEIEKAGRIFNPPHWRGRGSLAWTRENVRIGAIASYIGGTTDDRRPVLRKVDSFTTLDITARVSSKDEHGAFANIDLTLAALNVLNEKPSVILVSSAASYPYDSTNNSVLGRTVSLTISKRW